MSSLREGGCSSAWSHTCRLTANYTMTKKVKVRIRGSFFLWNPPHHPHSFQFLLPRQFVMKSGHCKPTVFVTVVGLKNLSLWCSQIQRWKSGISSTQLFVYEEWPIHRKACKPERGRRPPWRRVSSNRLFLPLMFLGYIQKLHHHQHVVWFQFTSICTDVSSNRRCPGAAVKKIQM